MTVTSAMHTGSARTCPEIELKIASTRAEREAAFRLIYQSYVHAGLCEVRASGLRVTRYQLQRSTDIFIAQLRGEILSTLSLVHDDRLGLPMEQVYADEVAERRGTGLRLAELSCLANRRTTVTRSFSLYCDLCSLMIQFAKKMEIDQVLAVVHPRHAALYRRYMAFEQMGGYRDYPAVQNNPGVALCLDVIHVEENLPPAGWKSFFGTRIPEEVLCPQPIEPADIEYFQAVTQCDGQPNRLAVEPQTLVAKGAAQEPESAEVVTAGEVDDHRLMCV